MSLDHNAACGTPIPLVARLIDRELRPPAATVWS